MTTEDRLNGSRETLVSLRDYIETQLDAHAEMHRQHEASHEREHKATDTAISKAEDATNKALLRADQVTTARFDAQNEWRSAMSDRERQFVPKTEWTGAAAATTARLDRLEDADIARSAREQERERSLTRTMALIGLGATVISVAMSILLRLASQ